MDTENTSAELRAIESWLENQYGAGATTIWPLIVAWMKRVEANINLLSHLEEQAVPRETSLPPAQETAPACEHPTKDRWDVIGSDAQWCGQCGGISRFGSWSLPKGIPSTQQEVS